MRKIEKGTFFLNGIEERVVTFPENRDDKIEITFGGKDVGFTESIPLKDFEEQTGYYIRGMEPDIKVDATALIQDFESHIGDFDYTISRNEKYLDSKSALSMGTCVFTNHRNVRMSAAFIINDKSIHEDDMYAIHVMKNDGGKVLQRTYFASDLELDSKLQDATAMLESYVSTRVQIINKVSDKAVDNDRKHSDEGFPILRDGETLSNYFDSTDKIGGIVINSKDKYQAFHSYVMWNGKDSLHHDTKDYKTLKGAVKLLESYGFDKDGRMLDNMNSDFEEGFKEAIMRDLSASIGEDNWGSFSLGNNGWVEVQEPVKTIDPVRGYQYALPYVYTVDLTGATITRTMTINNSIDMNGWNTSRMFSSLMHDFEKDIREGKIVLMDTDNRTVQEKLDYHADRFKHYKQRAGWAQERIDRTLEKMEGQSSPNSHDQHWLNRDTEWLNNMQEMMREHQDRFRELKSQMKPPSIER